MRLLVITGVVPRVRDGEEGVTAVHLVDYALLEALRAEGHDIALQVLFNAYRASPALAAAEKAALRDLETQGYEVLAPLHAARRAGGTAARAAREAALLGPAPVAYFYGALALRDEVRRRAAAARAEAVLTLWSSDGVAATDGLARPRVAYHGDIDLDPSRARAARPDLWPPAAGKDPARRALAAVRQRRWEPAHLRLMRGVDVIANVTASNATYYRERGHPRSVYVGNTWPAGPLPARPARRAGPCRIVGHVGALDRTGSTFGLDLLLRGVVPELERALAGLPHEVHVIGGGQLAPALREAARHPRVRMRGFVPDLDAELAACDAYLLLNNAGPYLAAYTRHMVAWSSGLPLVVHGRSRLAVPEVEPGVNCLSGDDARGISAAVHHLLTDPGLAARLREGGRATYEARFTPARVAARISAELAWAAEARGARPRAPAAPATAPVPLPAR